MNQKLIENGPQVAPKWVRAPFFSVLGVGGTEQQVEKTSHFQYLEHRFGFKAAILVDFGSFFLSFFSISFRIDLGIDVLMIWVPMLAPFLIICWYVPVQLIDREFF